MKRVVGFRRVLVFDYLRDLTDPNRNIEKWLETHDYQGVASLDTKNIGFIRVYERVDQQNATLLLLCPRLPPASSASSPPSPPQTRYNSGMYHSMLG